MESMELLKALSEAPGVSGHEAAVRKIIREAIQDHVEEIRVDNLGNLIARKSPATHSTSASSSLRVMVAAHMDEVGFMVVHIGNDGLLKFRTVGGIDSRIGLSKAVRVGEKGVPGIIGVKPLHLLSDTEVKTVLKIEDLVIDIGADSAEAARKHVKPGDYVTFDTHFSPAGDLVKGKAFDDRAGCVVLTALLKEDYPLELYATFTVQEEIGLRGAKVAAYEINPHLAFALEGTIADDLPKDKDVSPTTEVGKGPAISIMDRSVIPDRRLVRLLIDTAQAHAIPYQFRRALGGGTDAGRIHLAREGVPSAVVSVPCRYIHSPAALLSPQDLKHTITLMTHALKRLPAVWADTQEKQTP
jgi:endoglucanase